MKNKKKKKSKGFTLVELLAVIVILAVVMLIAVTAVGPIMERSRKQSLILEGKSLVKAAKNAQQTMLLTGTKSFTEKSNICFDMRWLCKNGYYDKGCNRKNDKTGDDYYGSVLVKYISENKYEYYYWIGNKTYAIGKSGGKRYLNCTKDDASGVNSTDDIKESDVIKTSSTTDYVRRCGMIVGNSTTTSNAAYYRFYAYTGSNATYSSYKTKVVNCYYRDGKNGCVNAGGTSTSTNCNPS